MSPTFTVTYLVADPASGTAAVIDPVLDFDPASARIGSGSVEAVLSAAEARGWRIEVVLETHAHADHLSGAKLIAARTGAWIGIGAQITQVQATFAPMFGADDVLPAAGDFDRLLYDGELIALGALAIEVLHTPGHTPACASYRIGDAVFVGDTLFMPDYGTARADFPGGDAHALYRSIRRLLSLPPETRLFLCHDYKAPGRDHWAWETTVAEQRGANIHVHDGIDEAAFVAARQARDATLAPPRLLLPSIQVNIRAGRLPPADAHGVRALRLPLRAGDEVAATLLS
ncbi:MBL fold metallo-hydrolase [Novosphingobium sediminis]|uniref:MBL fold metallo-hydrolase n=1 Tax=Novosphingobium sediminis TaxID=707214 RepID=A0A512AMU7_9SPHN|nr:MBL fold metallo-hydrolase [Novosphingobium sediminis]GEO01035.1 MBL fold metallo-hydrolase [Novosphingobium sediminis]